MASPTPDPKPSRQPWMLPLALVLAGVWSWTCQTIDPNDGSDSDAELDYQAVLDSIAHEVIVPATEDFVSDATALRSALDALAQAPNPAEATDELQAAQGAFDEAMLRWEQLELMQVGPAAPSSAVAGENIRDEIYSWPTVATCTIDRAIVDESFAEPDFRTSALILAYGLDALEYLLFVHDTGHTCGASVGLDGSWDALGFEEIERRRARYAAVVAAGIAAEAERLANRWSPEADDFAALLANPGQGDSPYEDEMHALDEVFRAMFYVDLTTKDTKLGRALGLTEGVCTEPPCGEFLELPYSGLAAGAIAENLRALRALLQGGPDPETADGFDDLLVAAGHEDIAETLLTDIDAAIAEAEGFEAPLQQTIVDDMARVESLHAAIKRVTDTLKGPFVLALMLTVPMEGAGDAD